MLSLCIPNTYLQDTCEIAFLLSHSLLLFRLIWRRIDKIAAEVVYRNQKVALEKLEIFDNAQNFFLLLRMDLVLDNKVTFVLNL